MKRLTKFDKKMIEFKKRYHKFYKNNMPTPFWDEERNTLEFVYYDSYSDDINHPNIYNNLYNAFENIIYDEFYYSFNCCHYEGGYDENNKWYTKKVIGHLHEHDFDSVIRWVYRSPETFSIDKVDEHLYSEQELRFIKRLQNYLLFLGYKDQTNYKAPVSRYRNKLRKKYESYLFRQFNDEKLNYVLNNEFMYSVYPIKDNETLEDFKYTFNKALVSDYNGKIVLAIEYTTKEIKEYKDIKKYCKIDIKDNDKVLLYHFKIIEKFN